MSFPALPELQGEKIKTIGSELQRQRHPWVRTGDGRCERTTTGQERWFGLLTAFSKTIAKGRESDSVRATVRFAPPPGQSEDNILAQLQDAWIRCRFDHPAIGCQFIDGGKLRYLVPGSEGDALSTWLEQSFIVSKGADAKTSFTTLPESHGPDLLYFPASHEVTFRAGHAIIDGRGAIVVLDSLFRHLATPKSGAANQLVWGDEVYRLPIATTDALGCTPADEVSEEDKAAYFALEGAYFASMPAPVGPPLSYTPGKPPGTPAVVSLGFTQEETKRIIQGSKAHGWSMTVSVHAAFTLANIRGSAYPLKDKAGNDLASYVNPAVFDHREHFPPPLNKPEYAVGCGSGPYIFSLPLASPPAATQFDEVAAFLTNFYGTTFRGGPGSQGEKRRKFNEFYFERLCALFTSPEAANAPKAPEAATSSLGLLDGTLQAAYGSWQVADFGFCVDVTFGLCAVHWWTFQDQLKMAYSYNDAYFEARDVQAILDLTKAILLERFSQQK